ncbi:type IV pilus secretin PilQ [Ghiorsea bivora]|uniref:type IV pilus secretin PilQ n=1 Tax=Ghiorsea bivora TaxID=1485545 RepID=UPI000691ED1B|nr:type IV pilus secretin PilQ [Ghiorsea bivora]
MKKNNGSYALCSWLKACFLVSMLMITSASWAGTISNVSLLDSKDGDMLIIESDEPLEYQIFDLNEPPRLVMTFPNADIDAAVVAIKGAGAGVTNVFPKKNELGVRIEIALSESLSYEVDEQAQSLVVHFQAVKSKQAVGNKAVVKKLQVKDKGDMTEVVLKGFNLDASHNSFLTNKNRTLVVDFWGGKSQLNKERFQFSSQRVKAITVGEAEDRLRLVVDLNHVGQMEQQIEASPEQFVIRFGQVEHIETGSAKVESVDFQPNGRLARVMIRTDVTNPVVLVSDDEGKTIIDIKNASLKQGQERTQDLRAFAGPLSQIDTYKNGENVRIVVRTRETVETTSFQQGNVFTMNFVPEEVAVSTRGKGKGDSEFTYKGEKVTFDFKDIDIRNALKLIAEMSDLNIIMSDDVTGTLTMRLVDVPWDQALELILSARGLGKEQAGNVLRVAPVEVLRSEYESKIEARKGSLQLEPLVTEFITLSYTKVEDVKTMLKDASKTAKKGAKVEGAMPSADNSGLMSSRGSILIDKRTNTIIIKDTLSAINNIKRLIKAIDTPIKQVLIEARIVEASDQFTHSIGVRWGGSVNRSTNTNFPGAVAIGSTATGGVTTGGATTGGVQSSITASNANAILAGGQTAATGRGFLVDLPATGNGGSIGFSLGSFSNAINLDLELSAAQADGTAKIVSNPRIVTSNLKQASVTQGSLVPIVTPGSANNPATTTLTKAALTLDVTPQITADGGVILDIVVTKDSPATFNGATGIDSKAVTTNVYVKNGETIVIGGVYTREKAFDKTSVPYLSEIPVLGWLFKSETKRDNKTELLIFITPKIMQGKSGV